MMTEAQALAMKSLAQFKVSLAHCRCAGGGQHKTSMLQDFIRPLNY
jgi:hypothetical protein